ncbi:hypothetical protein D1007_34993 [Hordeum vulgare]|nr:hypothetical protein D1007_34993 [Hordeum vulgare]
MMTTLLPGQVLGFLPAHGGGEGEVHPTPFRKGGGANKRHRIGVGQIRQRYLPTSRTHRPAPILSSTTPTTHQHAPPQSRKHYLPLTTTNTVRLVGLRHSHHRQGPASPHPCGRGQPPSTQAIADRTHEQEHTGPTALPSQDRARYSPAVALQQTQHSIRRPHRP